MESQIRPHTNVYAKIRKDFESYIGQEIQVTASTGRNVFKNYIGVIEGANANHFYMKRSDINTRESFPYADLFGNYLKVTALESGEELFNYEVDTNKKTVQLYEVDTNKKTTQL